MRGTLPFAGTGMDRLALLPAIAGLVAACATATPAPAPAPEPSQAVAEDEAFYKALHWSRNAAEHRALFEQTYTLAAQRLEELAEGRDPSSWAVSVDADETLIDNSRYDLEISRRGEEFNRHTWSEWVQRRAAPALPGAVTFTRQVKSLGGIVAVVTNRRTHNCPATADNLRQIGITFDVILCRAEDGEKEPRWEALSAGTASQWPQAQLNGGAELAPVEVLMWLGDNIGDFPGQDQEIRQAEGSLDEFGDRFFVFPNPRYGSWEDNPKE